jgi:hypothetical protein
MLIFHDNRPIIMQLHVFVCSVQSLKRMYVSCISIIGNIHLVADVRLLLISICGKSCNVE